MFLLFTCSQDFPFSPAQPYIIPPQIMFKTASLFLTCMIAMASARDLQGQTSWGFDLVNVAANFGADQLNQFVFTYTNGESLTEASAVIGSIWDATCTNQVNVGGLTTNGSTVDGTSTTSTVTVDFSSLGSAVWSTVGTTGQIAFCYRSVILIEGFQLNYVDTKIEAEIDILNDNLTVTGLTVEDKDASVRNELTAGINYPLTAVPCNALDEEVAAPQIAPGGSIKICITLPSADSVAGVSLASVYDAKLTQAITNIEFEAISEGVPNSFTSTSCPADGLCTVETTVVGAFFAADENALSLSGSCIMAIGRRMLEVPMPSIRGARNMVEGEGRGNFDIAIALATDGQAISSANDSSSSSSSSVLFAASTLFALALV